MPNIPLLVHLVFLRMSGVDQAVEAGDTVSLTCEMHGYIHSDDDFLWLQGNEIVRNGDRMNIALTSGAEMRGQSGDSSPGPSRLSTLTISSVRPSDAGVYTCFVMGTGKEASSTLSVSMPINSFKPQALLEPGTHHSHMCGR